MVYFHWSHFPSPFKRGENATGLSASPAGCPISSSPPCSFLTPGTGSNPPLESASHPGYQVISSSRGYNTPGEVSHKPLQSVSTKEIWGPAAEQGCQNGPPVWSPGPVDTTGKSSFRYIWCASAPPPGFAPRTSIFPDRICARLC